MDTIEVIKQHTYIVVFQITSEEKREKLLSLLKTYDGVDMGTNTYFIKTDKSGDTVFEEFEPLIGLNDELFIGEVNNMPFLRGDLLEHKCDWIDKNIK